MIRLVHQSMRRASFSTRFPWALALAGFLAAGACAAPPTPPESTPVYGEHVHPAGARVEVHRRSVSEPEATQQSADVTVGVAPSPPSPTEAPTSEPVPEPASEPVPEPASSGEKPSGTER